MFSIVAAAVFVGFRGPSLWRRSTNANADRPSDEARQKAKRQARKLILRLVGQSDQICRRIHTIGNCDDKVFVGLAMVAAMQGQVYLLGRLLALDRPGKLDHRQLLKAAFADDAICKVNRQLVGAGLLTLNEAQNLAWVEPSQEQRQHMAQRLVDDFLRVVQEDFIEPARAIKELGQYCQARGFSVPYLYLQNARLAW